MIRTDRLTRPQLAACIATLAATVQALEEQASLLGQPRAYATIEAAEQELARLEDDLYSRDFPPAPRTVPVSRRVSDDAGLDFVRMLRAVGSINPVDLASQAPELYREMTRERGPEC